MAEIRISTAGTQLFYAVEATAGVRPTAASAYTEVKEPVSIPAVNETPNTLDATSLNAVRNHVYIPALSDSGGAIGITANMSQPLLDQWNKTIVPAYEAGQESNPAKNMWFCVVIPGMTDAFYMQAEPTLIGLPSMEVDSVFQCTLPLVPTGDMDWYAAPTISG